MELPDVIGRTYEQAVRMLNNAGYSNLKAVMTSPPQRGVMSPPNVDEDSRVLKIQILDDNTVELIVCMVTKLETSPS
ncbi:MAG: PASTA domain-containing protein [Eubacteriales bacterium]|nr:PASTA domain-containing protein [Eubacteriales bacterium]